MSEPYHHDLALRVAGPEPEPRKGRKVNVLLQGEIATGKTFCLRTLIDHVEPFIISLEPGLDATLHDYICPRGPIHHRYITPANVSWDQIKRYALLAATLPLDRLINTQDPSRTQYDQYHQIFSTCTNFECDGCQHEFGDVGEWTEDRAIAVDGLTGVTKAARQMIIGARPVIGKHEYQPIQGFIEAFLELLWSGTKCSAILLAHTDRRPNEITGVNQVTIDTAGPALVRKLVRKPDEIITCERNEKGVFTWNTTYTQQTVTKHRRLPESDTLPPDFSQLFNG